MYAELAQTRADLCAPGQLFEMEEVEVRGQTLRAWKHAPATLRDFWLATAGHADRDYLVYNDERLTYTEAHEKAARLARWMVDNGIQPGDRVAIAMRNYPEYLLSYWAIVSIGAVVVGVNAWWVPEELQYGLNDSAPKLIICDRERLERWQQVRGDLPEMQALAVRCDEPLPEGVVAWDTAMQADADLPEASIDPDSDACIFYTSGTTGHPKGAQLTHRGCTNNILSAIFSNLSQLSTLAKMAGRESSPPGQSAILLTTPLFHVTANNVIAHANTFLGNTLIHMYKWDAAEAIRLIEREKISSLSGVPAMAREVLTHPDYEKADLSSLSAVGGGGAAVQPDLVEKIDDKSGAAAVSAYGMTELCGLITGIFGPFFSDKPGSVGPVLPTHDVKCVDESGNTVPVGERGEVLLRGPQVIKGYLNRPDATAETIVDGWLHTGDIGYLDEDGFLFLVDRAKDMVLRGGENIYCAEVEAVLYRYPAVAEAVVFAVPDEVLGEEVGCAIFPKEGETLDADALRAYCKEHMAAYKIPRFIWTVGEPLPRNASGKFLKKTLQAELDTANAL